MSSDPVLILLWLKAILFRLKESFNYFAINSLAARKCPSTVRNMLFVGKEFDR
jgi:hypothetical protein